MVGLFEPGILADLYWTPPDPNLPEWSNGRERPLAGVWSLDTSGSKFRIQRLWTYPETATVDRETAEAITSGHLEDERVEESSLTVHGRVVELRQTGPLDAFQ